MSNRYDRKIDSEHFNPASSNEKILMQVQPGSKVLECGCATGYMTHYMRDELGCNVSIVEYDAEAYAVARQYANDGICADLMQSDWLAKFQGEKFDYILFADVLEHLYDPQAVLKSAAALLKEGGSILASVPNIAHGDILLNLWKGNWNYTETGLLDRTHIRFFAENNLESFFRGAGLSITRLDYTTHPIGQTEQAYDLSGMVSAELRLLGALRERESAAIYQFIIAAQPIEYVEQYHIKKEQPIQGHQTMATLYYSQRDEFSEENAQKIFYMAPDFHQRFEWKNIRPKFFRFDPVEGQACVITSLQVLSNEGELEIYPANGYRLGHMDVFGTGDPQYCITAEHKNIEWIEIHAQIGLVSNGQLQSGIAQLAQNCVKLEDIHRSESREIQELEQENQELEQMNQELEQMNQELERRIQECSAQNEALSQSLNVMQNSTIWRMTKPLRMILDKLKRIRHPKAKKIEKKTKQLGLFPPEAVDQVYKHTIDVIVPVFNGYLYLERLLSSIEQTEVPYQLILVEDKSTDSRVLPLLRDYAGQHSNVVLLENETNLGFIQSVNRGLSYSENHAAIVNTDVVLPERWLERLMLPIIAGEKVASSTPFTNSGTICSFPNFCQNNELFLGLDVQQIDAEFAKIVPQYPLIPTGVGFCMGMNREALDLVGLLDAETFGRGYGEENDWCRRAAEAGFVNVHVENLFVYHQHGASFASEEKQALLKKNGESLQKKHPDYNRIVAQYCREDPCGPIREQVKEQLLRKDAKRHTVLAFNHSWGGGATAYLQRECRQLLYEGKRAVLVEYQPEKKAYQIKYLYETEILEKTVSANTFSALSKALPERVDEIWVNELVTYPNLYQVLEEIPALAKSHGASLRYLLHDYFALCPTINLLRNGGKYCGLPDIQSCERCLKSNTHFKEIHCAERKAGITAWRAHWLEFLKQCDEIRTFSDASRDLLVQVFTSLPGENITVRPHQIDYLPQISCKKKRTNTLNVGVFGVVTESKGLDLVRQMAKQIKQDGLNMRLIIIGEPSPPIAPELCRTTGPYQRFMLPGRVLENDIDLVLIPSIWPETFSYTAEEAMTMGLPIACFDIGAPAERIAKYKEGIVLPQIDAESALYQLQKYAKERLVSCPDRYRSVLFVAERKDYASRYRVEHFQEELLFHGVGSDFVLTHEIRRVNISRYDAVVIYRCSSVRDGNYLRREADRAGIKLFFDIDDLVFDSEAVLKSCMPEKEKNAYLSKADGYCANMRQADGLIASTEVLAERMKNLFPEKEVCVRRNSASLEMETLSVCAGQDFKGSEDDAISLAYFSGSWTHDGDFAQITEPLLHIFQKYPNVKLKVYGCLNIPSQLEGYRSRIEQYEFTTDWRSLPEKSAQAQIHLAPLENTLLNACKSENKWMEAALTGRVTVMSSLPELERMVQNGENGFLCKTQEEWETSLSLLIESADLRNKIGRNAQECVLNTHLTRNSGKAAALLVLEKCNLE